MSLFAGFRPNTRFQARNTSVFQRRQAMAFWIRDHEVGCNTCDSLKPLPRSSVISTCSLERISAGSFSCTSSHMQEALCLVITAYATRSAGSSLATSSCFKPACAWRLWRLWLAASLKTLVSSWNFDMDNSSARTLALALWCSLSTT